MKTLCTVSDFNYLNKGIALIDSLCQNTDTTLYYLCIDQKTYDFFNKSEWVKNRRVKIIPIHIIKLLKYFPKLQEFKDKNTHTEFCWSLASTFCLYILKELNKPDVLYIDSDIYFYRPLEEVYQEIGSKSIGIITHRQPQSSRNVGKFNVGIIYFKNDEKGMDCLRFWNGLVLDKNNGYAKEYGTCGDQKYLELFIPQYGKDVCVIDTIAHLASWNVQYANYHYEKDDLIVEFPRGTGIKQPLMFYHFSHFHSDKDSFHSNYNGEWKPETNPFIFKLYDDYHKKIISADNIIHFTK